MKVPELHPVAADDLSKTLERLLKKGGIDLWLVPFFTKFKTILYRPSNHTALVWFNIRIHEASYKIGPGWTECDLEQKAGCITDELHERFKDLELVREGRIKFTFEKVKYSGNSFGAKFAVEGNLALKDVANLKKSELRRLQKIIDKANASCLIPSDTPFKRIECQGGLGSRVWKEKALPFLEEL